MRGAVTDLASAAPIAFALPGVYHDDDFVLRFVGALDEGLAPVLLTLDNLAAYVDPALAPPDFLDWLAGWVGIELDDAWPVDQRREVVANAVRLHRLRGTAAGIAEEVRLAAGPRARRVEVEESGGAVWSAVPGRALPGEASPRLVVRVYAEDPVALEHRRLEAVVTSAKPAHVPHTLELLADDDDTGRQ